MELLPNINYSQRTFWSGFAVKRNSRDQSVLRIMRFWQMFYSKAHQIESEFSLAFFGMLEVGPAREELGEAAE